MPVRGALLALIASFLAAEAAQAKQPVVFHKKVPRSALLRKQRVSLVQEQLGSGMHGMELLRALAGTSTDPAPGAGSVAASVKDAQTSAAETLHNTETERDMLETQLLANGEGLHVIKKLADTVQKMKSQVEVLENHERICRKKLADLQSSQNEVSQDTAYANSVDGN